MKSSKDRDRAKLNRRGLAIHVGSNGPNILNPYGGPEKDRELHSAQDRDSELSGRLKRSGQRGTLNMQK